MPRRPRRGTGFALRRASRSSIRGGSAMSQVNVNPSGPPVRDDGGDRAAAAGINFLTVIVVLAVVVALLWFLFSGPIRGLFRGTSDVNINVTTPAQTQPQIG